jgi:hypothetical protein
VNSCSSIKSNKFSNACALKSRKMVSTRWRNIE